MKLLAPLAAALALAAGSASAATYLIDFESEVAGSPWGALIDSAWIGGGVIGAENGNNFLTPNLRNQTQSTRVLSLFGGPVIGPGTYVSPQILSLDVYFTNGGSVALAGGQLFNVGAGWSSIAFTPQPATHLNCVWGCNLFFHGDDIRVDNVLLEVAVAVVPEPATWAMMIAGFGLAGAGLRRHRNQEVRQRFGRA